MGFLTEGLPALATFTGLETINSDTQAANGSNPQSESIALYKLALLMTTMLNSLDKTMVAGTIYYCEYEVGVTYTPTPRGSAISENSYAITGVNVPVGTPGGTDTWHVGVWNSSGVLVARSITAGVTAGTALTIQQIPLYATDGSTVGPITLTSGVYYIGLQSSGTTAKFKSINSPIWGTTANPVVTGSQAGAAGTLPAITTIAAGTAGTFTANLAPLLSLY